MSIMQKFKKGLPYTPTLSTLDDGNGGSHSSSWLQSLRPRISVLKKRIRLKGNSSVSVPLGVVLLFPFIVVICILVLFLRHPSSPGRVLMPAGAPPAIR